MSSEYKNDFQSTQPSDNQEADDQEIILIQKKESNPQRLFTNQSHRQDQNYAQRKVKTYIPISYRKTPPNENEFSMNTDIQEENIKQKSASGLNSSQDSSDKSLIDFEQND